MLNREAVNLDSPEVYRQFDREDMLGHLQNFPQLCHQAWQQSMSFGLPRHYSQINKVVILGMGGSAIGGDLLSTLVFNESGVPLLICRDYDLPRYVDEETLVVASSYSGMTEETLSAFEQAFDTPAKILAVTSGGRLKALSEIENVPVFSIDYKSQPRAALPFSFFPLLGILQNLGILQDKALDISETISHLNGMVEKINQNVPAGQNPAKSLASKLYGRLPVIYGAGITAEVARRWKSQINENSKTLAFFEVFPELNHNSVVGYGLPEELTRQMMVVFLDADGLHEQVHLRYEITRKLLEQAGIYYQVLKGEGARDMSQMMTLVLFGDYVSCYLAVLNQVDPTPVKAIDYIKENLSQR